MEKVFNPVMLKLMRKARGFNQTAFSKLVEVTQGAYSKIEQGFMEVDGVKINRFSDILKVPVDFFYLEEKMFPPATPLHRSRSAVSKNLVDKIEAIANLMRIQVNILLESIDDFKVTIPKIDNSFMSPEEIANNIRSILHIPYGPIDNMIDIIENCGIFVVELDFETEKIDGFSMFGTRVQPIIFINRSFPADRKRFTLAHEFGHLIMHDNVNYNEFNNIEDEANRFASEFLMPSNEIKSQLSNLNIAKLVNLKRIWKVSMAAILHKAGDLKTITQNQSKYLWIQMSKKGYRRKEPVVIEEEKSSLINELIEFYKEDLNYSVNDLLSLLKIDQYDYDYFYNDKKFRLWNNPQYLS